MNISVSVMAHPKRKPQAQALALQLKKYPFIGVTIIWDELNEEWHTGKRALYGGIVFASEWHVVIQDDALLTPYFYDNLVAAINALPEPTLLSLYTGTARPLPDRVSAAVAKAPVGSFLEFRQLLWGVGIAIPTNQIAPMLEFVEDIALQYDNKIGEFYCRQGAPVYYTVPSLVDHDDDLDTLIDGHGRHVSHEPRRAVSLATERLKWSSDKTYI